MKDLSKITTIAILVEGIITYLNEFFVSGNSPWQMILSLILGISVALAYNLDLSKHFNLNSTSPYVGNIITGILISRGSNYLYDLLYIFKSINL